MPHQVLIVGRQNVDRVLAFTPPAAHFQVQRNDLLSRNLACRELHATIAIAIAPTQHPPGAIGVDAKGQRDDITVGRRFGFKEGI